MRTIYYQCMWFEQLYYTLTFTSCLVCILVHCHNGTVVSESELDSVPTCNCGNTVTRVFNQFITCTF